MTFRSILEPWENTSAKPSPFEPTRFVQENFAPCFTAEEYVEYVNKYKIQAIHRYDEEYAMPGRYTHAEIVDGKVWVTFSPEKLGKYWVNYSHFS